jgi:GNAT superfamily N-acetyltransferase
MKNIIFRHYEKGDDAQLADLFNRSFQMNGASFLRTPKSWNWRYVQSPGFEPEMIQIAEDGSAKKIVGAICVNLVENILLNGEKLLNGEINDVSCLPEYTRQGIAKQLMKKAIEYLDKRKCDISMLTADYHGFARKRIYLKEGYKDIDREQICISIPNPFQLIKDLPILIILFPALLLLSCFPRLFNRVLIKKVPALNNLSYEIIQNKNHITYMNALNRIMSKNYEGFHPYSMEKYTWARIKVPSRRHQPTYVIVRNNTKIVGGAEMNDLNIYATKFGIKFKIGLIHEIFLDKDTFKSKIDQQYAYLYLVDKILKASIRRSVGLLIMYSSSYDLDLNQTFRRFRFFIVKGATLMIKSFNNKLKLSEYKNPLYIPTHVSFSIP